MRERKNDGLRGVRDSKGRAQSRLLREVRRVAYNARMSAPQQQAIPSGTVTFLFTDIEGSTRLAQENPASWEAARARHHAIVRGACDARHGYVFQMAGDAFCVAFAQAANY